MQVRFGDQMFVSTPGYGQPMGGIEKLLEGLQNAQQKFIIEQWKLNGIDSLKTFFENSNRSMPAIVKNTIDNKVSYIVGLMSASMRERNSATRYRYMNDEINRFGTMKFRTGSIEQRALGTFIQNTMMFGGRTGGEGFAGASAAAADLSRIKTELKTTTKFSKKPGVGTGWISSGTISGGITGAENDKTAIEQELNRVLETENQKKNLAILQLYTKMRNLLYMKSEFSHSPNQKTTYVHFVAIILFTEIIIEIIRQWVEYGITDTTYQKAKLAFSKGKGEKPTTTVIPRPLIRIVNEGIGVNPVKGGQITISQHYEIKLENLEYEKGNISKDMNTVLKNIGQLYLFRTDVLETITGPGKGDKARRFFSIIEHLEQPAFNMENANLPFNL